MNDRRANELGQPDEPAALSIAVILGAGGAVGGLFIDGAVEQLSSEAGFRIGQATMLVGTSAGAFRVGSVEELPRPGDSRQLLTLDNGPAWRPRRFDRPLAGFRRLAGRALARVTPTGRPPGDYRVPGPPYHSGGYAVSVARANGRRTVHWLSDEADPEAAIAASAAVPFAVAPVSMGGSLQIDGAVHSPTNADLCLPGRFDAIVVIAPMLPDNRPAPLARLHRAQLRHELVPWSIDGSGPVIVITPTVPLRSVDRSELMESGRAVVRGLIRGVADAHPDSRPT